MKRFCTVLAALALSLSGELFAQSDYPSKPIRMIIPYAPGGPSDVVARLVATKMSERLKQPVVAENRPGAGALIGGEAVARSAADGYTILSAGGSAYSRVFVKNPPFEVLRDLTPISRTHGGGLMLIVNGQIPARTVKEFIDYAKANRGKLNYGSAAPTTILAMEMFKKIASFEATPIGYKGSAPITIALATGDLHATVDVPMPYVPLIQAGKVRALAIGADRRLAILPDVPTMAEAGFPTYKVEYNSGLWAPVGTPREIIERLNGAVIEAVRLPDLQDTVRKAGLFAVSSTPEAFRQVVEAEIDFWSAAAKIANYQPE